MNPRTEVGRPSDGRYLGLEGLRGVAALMVAARHAPDLFAIPARSSHLAVDLFFVVSGFVLAHAYEARFQRGLGAAGFMRLRLIRLYPLYVLALVVAVADHLVWRFTLGDPAWSGGLLARTFAAGLLFLPCRGPAPDIFPLDMPAWSLAFELLANLAYALAAPHLTTRRLALFTALAGAALAITGAHFGSLNLGWRWSDAAAGLPRVLFAFPMGILLHRLLGGRQASRIPAAAPALLLLVVLTFDAGGRQALYEVVTVLVASPLLVALAALSRPTGALGRAYCLLGATSYGVYVLHVPVFAGVKGALQTLGLAAAPPLAGTGLLLLLALAVLGLDRVYDAPLRRWLCALRLPATGAATARP